MQRAVVERVVDLGLVLVLAAVGLAELWIPFPSVLGSGPRALTTVLVVAMTVPLVFRRRWPLLSALPVLWLWPLVFLVEPVHILFWGQFVPMAVAVFSTARYGRGRVPWLGAAAGVATLLFFDLRVDPLQAPGEIVFHWMVFTVAWCLGGVLRVFEDRARASTLRAVQVEVAAAEEATAAVLAERTRIARELHDIVAHSVSVMVVQAGAAEQVVDEDSEFVRQALATVRETGTNALSEMRRVLAVLRDGEEDLRSPQPGLDALPSLLTEVRNAGIEATVEVEGRARPLPPGLDLAAYRIVQEALTNVRRHANARRATVVLRYSSDDMGVEVTDDGVGAGVADPAPTGGHGLVGMRERVGMYGGELTTGATSGRGFTVRARFPLERA